MSEAHLSERPTHIIVFKNPSESNENLLSQVLDIDEVKGISTRASCVIMGSEESGETKLYKSLGVAVSSLTDDQVINLRESGEILAIEPNQVRSIPPIAFPETELLNKSSDSLSAYLRGMRDAIDSIERFHLGIDHSDSIELQDSFTSLAARRNTFSWCLQQIGMSPNYRIATGLGVKVAVLDTGIDLNHPDFAGSVIEGDNTKSFVEGESVQDGNGHGTHCAGVIGGARHSASGIRYSVAPDVDLVIGKVLNNKGFGNDDQILDAIDWARDQGAKIISMSLGSDRRINQPHPSAYENIAEILSEQGILIVAAAGNNSNRPQFTQPVNNPAACPSIKAVAAIGKNRKVASFSSAQMDQIGTLDISAPGVAVYSAYKNGTYTTISGTSMATPHIAGVAALYYQLNPSLSVAEIWQLILSNALTLGDVDDYGIGLVQVP
jgi:subtilisin